MNFLLYSDLDWMSRSLGRVIIIIGILQLVKKIPEIINIVFGTNIKDRGGIKGRLGEMAGVGGLAQQAWTSLGNLGKNLGKLYFSLPFAAGAVGANVGYHAKTKKWLKDDPRFQQLKGIGYGIRGAVKSGSWMTGYQEYEKGSEPPQHTRSELMEYRKNVTDKLAAGGAGNEDGSWSNIKKDADGNIVKRYDSKSGEYVVDYKKRNEIIDEITNGKNAAKQLLSSSGKLGKGLSDQFDTTVDAKIKYNDLVSVKEAGDKVAGFASNVHNMLSSNPSIYSEEEINKAAAIAAQLAGGDRLVAADDAEFLKRYMDKNTAGQFATAVLRYDDALQTTKAAHDEYATADLYRSSTLGGLINAAKDDVDASVASEQAIVDKMSDIDKVAYQAYSNILDKQTGALVIANKFNPDAPADLVNNADGQQVQGWADASDWGEGAGSGVKSTSSTSSSSSSKSGYGSSENETGLFESSGANAPKRRSSSGARHYWEANTGKYGQAEDREKRMKSAEAGDEWEDYGGTIDD